MELSELFKLLAQDEKAMEQLRPLLEMVRNQPRYPEAKAPTDQDKTTTKSSKCKETSLKSEPVMTSTTVAVQATPRPDVLMGTMGEMGVKATAKWKTRDYNYASYDCNAKVLDTNPDGERYLVE